MTAKKATKKADVVPKSNNGVAQKKVKVGKKTLKKVSNNNKVDMRDMKKVSKDSKPEKPKDAKKKKKEKKVNETEKKSQKINNKKAEKKSKVAVNKEDRKSNKDNKTKPSKKFVKNGDSSPTKKNKLHKVYKSGKIEKPNKSNTGRTKRELRLKRQQREKDADLIALSSDSKQIWEQLRRDDCENKEELIEQLYEKIKGKISSLVFAHDTVRVVECMVALGNNTVRSKVFDELKNDFMQMAKSKYASFLVAKIIKYGDNAQKRGVMQLFKTNFPKLMRHKTANIVVNDLYNDHASTQEQNCIVQEFFGPHFKHSVLQRPGAKNVLEVLKDMESKSKSVLKHLAQHCTVLIHKGCYNLSLVHAVIWNYVLLIDHLLKGFEPEDNEENKEIFEEKNEESDEESDKEEEEDKNEAEDEDNEAEVDEEDEDVEKQNSTDTKPLTRKALLNHRSTLITSLRDACVHMLHTREGMRITLYCLWHGTTKDRKAMIKSFKSYVAKICSEEQGYKTFLALFDTVDDTKLVSKLIIKEIIDNMDQISKVESGRKVLMYLMAPRDQKYLAPDVIQLLKEGDNNEHSKKDLDTRWSELRAEMTKPLGKYLAENMAELVKDKKRLLLLICYCNNADESQESQEVMDKLAWEASRPFASTSIVKDEWNLIEDAAGHRLLKKIIDHDKTRKNNDEKSFSECLLNALDEDGMESWLLCNRGCFLLLHMVETDIENVVQNVKERLKGFVNTLKGQKSMGAQLLRKKLQM